MIAGIWKKFVPHTTIWIASLCLTLGGAIFSFSFETWMVLEHEKLGHRQEALTDTFWLMTFSESAALIGSQILANWLAGNGSEILSPSTVAVFLGMINMIFIARGWTDPPTKVGLQDYKKSLVAIIFGDRRIWLLSCAQASLNFSTALTWILWAPTVVADGREVHLGLMYPCFMGARMLGSSLLPWFTTSGLSALRTEDFLLYSFIISGLVLSVVAYDYQEIGVLLVLFCIFHACAGLMLPSLAGLRTMYVPNECRAAMMSMSLVPAFAALLLTIYSGGYQKIIYNSTMMAFAAFSLFVAAGCMYMLKRLGKVPHQNWHKL